LTARWRRWRTPKGQQPCLVRGQGQSAAPQPCRQHRPPPPCVIRTLKAAHDVIPRAAQGGLPPQPWLHLGCQPSVEPRGPRDVTQQRGEPRPLDGTPRGLHPRLAVEAPPVHALVHESQQCPISAPHLEPLLSLGALPAVEAGHQVCRAAPPPLAPLHLPRQCTNGVVGTAPGSAAIRAREKVLLVESFEHLAYYVLDHLVLACREAARPRLALSLGDGAPSDGRRAVRLCLQPRGQLLQGGLQGLPGLFLGAPIHPYRRLGTLPARGAREGRPIHERRQCVDSACGCALRSFHSLQKSWCQGRQRRSVGPGSLLQFTPTRAALARSGPSATPVPDVKAPMPPSDSLPPSAAAPVPLASDLPRGGRLCYAHVGRRPVPPHTRRAPEPTHRLSATPAFLRGEARAAQGTGPSSAGVLGSHTPPETSPLLAQQTPARRGCCGLRCNPALSASGKHRCRGRSPTARTFACLRIAHPMSGISARLATGPGGRTLGRADVASAGR